MPPILVELAYYFQWIFSPKLLFTFQNFEHIYLYSKNLKRQTC